MQKRAFLGLAMLALGSASRAQVYPSKPITFVVGAPPGGAVDVLARSMAEEMGKKMGQAIIVDNKPGGGGVIAAHAVARAAPDGYTVLVAHSGPVLTAPYLLSKIPYDVRRDFAFISQICTGQLVLAVNPTAVPVRNMQEFLGWANKHKGRVSYGSFGIGSSAHLLSSYLNDSRHLDMVHVAYKGEPLMIQDLIGGQIDWGFATLGALAPFVANERVRPLAVLGKQRVAELPDVPTMTEAGFKDPEFAPLGWIAMLTGANTPAPIVQRLEDEARAAIQSTALKSRFQAFGMEAMGTTSAEFRRNYDAQVPMIQRLITASGATAQ